MTETEPPQDLPDGEHAISSGRIFRAGGTNPGNMTPRPDDAHGSRRGLSGHVNPQGAISHKPVNEPPKKYPLAIIDVSALVYLEVYQDATGHISMRPPSQAELEAWIQSGGKVEVDGQEVVHPLTQEVRDAVVGKQTIER